MTFEFSLTEKQDEAVDLLRGNQRYTLLYGGSRSGKTFLLCRVLAIRAQLAEGSRHVILRQAFNHVKTSIWMDTFPKMLKLCFPDSGYRFNNTDYFIEFPNKSQIWIAGLDDKERVEKILGTEYATMYYNEASQLKYEGFNTSITRLAQKTGLKNRCYIDCNPPPMNHWLYKVFIEHIHPDSKEPLDPENYRSMLMNPADNIQNLDPEYLSMLEGLPKRERDRFLHGKFLDAFEGSLWNRDIIKHHKMPVEKALELCKRIIVGIDPAVTADPDSDETGIIVAGKTREDNYLVLKDMSGIYKAHEWAQIACNLYHTYKADMIVAEVNNGGDLVERSIKFEDKSVKFKKVNATRGKFVRAEPIQGLYERDLVKHINEFDLLEDQMCHFVPDNMLNSPDRVDALVWTLTELADLNKAVPRIR